MRISEVLVAAAVVSAVIVTNVVAQVGGIDPCYRLDPDGTCGSASEENPRTLLCGGLLYPAWTVSPGIVHKCEPAIGSGQKQCVESIEDECHAQLQHYRCTPGGIQNDGPAQDHGPGYASAWLYGLACP